MLFLIFGFWVWTFVLGVVEEALLVWVLDLVVSFRGGYVLGLEGCLKGLVLGLCCYGDFV